MAEAEAADFTEAVVEKADNHESGVWPIASCRYRLRLGNGWYALVNESIVIGQRVLVYAHIEDPLNTQTTYPHQHVRADRDFPDQYDLVAQDIGPVTYPTNFPLALPLILARKPNVTDPTVPRILATIYSRHADPADSAREHTTINEAISKHKIKCNFPYRGPPTGGDDNTAPTGPIPYGYLGPRPQDQLIQAPAPAVPAPAPAAAAPAPAANNVPCARYKAVVSGRRETDEELAKRDLEKEPPFPLLTPKKFSGADGPPRLEKDFKAKHRVEAIFLSEEYLECLGCLTKCGQTQNQFIMRCCSCGKYEEVGGGKHKKRIYCAQVYWVKSRDGDRHWKCTQKHPKLCEGLVPASPAAGSTAYSKMSLYYLCLQVKDHSPAKLKELLQPYCQRTLARSWLSDLKKKLEWARLGGPPEEALHRLPAVLAALKDKGWKTWKYTVKGQQMHRILVAWAKEEHDAKLGPFDESSVPQLDDSKDYVLAIGLSPPWAPAALKAALKVTASDFAHCHDTSISY